MNEIGRKILCIILCLLLIVPVCGQGAEGALRSGNKGSRVVQLQKRLKEVKLYTGDTDGIYGSKTEKAVQRAQEQLSLAGYEVEITGVADENTLTLIYDENCTSALLTLRRGSSGTRVKELQSRLIELNLLNAKADGDFGEKTEQAVLTFQQRMAELGVEGLGMDGAASPELVEILQSDLSVYGFHCPLYYDESHPEALAEDDLYAPSVILIDGPSGEVLFEKNAHTRMYPASTTKVMTLLLAVEGGDLDRLVTVPDSAGDVPSDSSLVPVYPGEEMTLRDLLYGLMIRSGNDAANAVAELCGGSVEEFVAQMNQRAQELGLEDTHFTNPHGYQDEDHYTTASDLAVITRLGLTDPDFCQIVTCLQYTLPATSKRKELTIRSTHEIFDPESEYYIPYAAGVKSGTTKAAGFCYIGAWQKGEQTLIAVIMGSSGKTYAWKDLKKLFAYGEATR